MWEGVVFTESGQGPVAGGCEDGNEPLSSTKGEEILGYLSDY